MVKIGKKLKKNNVAVDVVCFGDLDEENMAKLEVRRYGSKLCHWPEHACWRSKINSKGVLQAMIVAHFVLLLVGVGISRVYYI